MPILYADDNPEDRERWSEFLRKATYTVKDFAEYEETERQLQSGGYDLAILDLDLRGEPNGMAGLELAREYGRSIPTIILTAYGRVEAALEAFKPERGAPAVNFVEKASGPQKLLQAVHDTLMRRIFVVHGHDIRSLLEVTDFLKAKELWPVVLRDQPGLGRTIIEKFEESSNVGFAVVLLTPDDVGGERRDPIQVELLKLRPRQNALFELGFFIGRLGRKRVAALCEDHERLELPSDYSGVQFIPKDPKGEWRRVLAEEMWRGGVPIRH